LSFVYENLGLGIFLRGWPNGYLGFRSFVD